MDAKANFVVTWSSLTSDGSHDGVYAQRFDASGAMLGNEFRVNGISGGLQAASRIAMDPAGDFAIAWAGNVSSKSGTAVFAKRYNALGVAQGFDTAVSASNSGTQLNARIAMGNDGGFLVAYTGLLEQGVDAGVFAQKINAAGLKQGSEIHVNRVTAGDQFADSVATNGTGNYVITLTSNGQDGSGPGVFGQRFITTAPATPAALNGDAGDNSFYLRMNPDGLHIDVWQGVTGLSANSPLPSQSLLKPAITTLTVAGGDGNDQLLLDCSLGNPIPPGGISFDGGAGIDTIVYVGSSNADAVSLSASGLSFLNEPAAITFAPSTVERFKAAGNGGADTLSVTGGSWSINCDTPPAVGPGFMVNATAATSGSTNITFDASQRLAGLSLVAGARAMVVSPASGAGSSPATPLLLQVGSLNIADAKTQLDLGTSSMIVRSGNLSAVEANLALGFNAGDWKGRGLTSSNAAANIAGTTALGAAVAGDIGATTFAGQPVNATDVLVKYTYYGDADLSGSVNGDDESLLLAGLKQGGPAHWAFGDFDYSGHVTGDDYSLFLAGLRKQPVL
jgi:hypothetical protein